MAAVSLRSATVAHFAPGIGASCNRQPSAQEAISGLRSSCDGSTSYPAAGPSSSKFAAGAFPGARSSGAQFLSLSAVRTSAFTGAVQSSRRAHRHRSDSRRHVAVRAEQGQKERQEAGTKEAVRNVLNEIKDKRGVEAVKAGANAAKKEAQQDLDWYRSLNKPWYAPPEPVYGIVWSGLYALMAVATWIVVTEGGGFQKQALPLAVFGAQLFFNFRWPQLFFVDKKIGAAQIDNLFLFASILLTYQLYQNVSPTAGLLILPTVIWVGFANVLNYVILTQNPGDASSR